MEVSSSKKVVMLQNKQTGFTYVTWTKREYFRFTNKLCVFFFLKMEEQKKMKISRKDNWIAKVSKSQIRGEMDGNPASEERTNERMNVRKDKRTSEHTNDRMYEPANKRMKDRMNQRTNERTTE